METSKSQLRLFLSVDITGSTKLKNSHNLQGILSLYKERKIFIDDIRDSGHFDLDKEKSDFLDKLLLSNINLKDLDWAAKLKSTFSDFHVYFDMYLKKLLGEDYSEQYPWKGIGDELVYSIHLKNKKQAHKIVDAFIAALRNIDEKLKKGKVIRLRGAGWVAGFPVRNRIVELPFPDLYLDTEAKDTYPYPKYDYLGPEMDIGFRLGKCNWSGILAISLELAELLGNCDVSNQIRIQHMGWEKLKGVWNGYPYPIFWAYLTKLTEKKLKKEELDIDYIEYNDGDEVELKYLIEWNEKEKIKEAKFYLNKIEQIRENLPSALGVIKPYILAENDEIPHDHQQILNIIESIKKNAQYSEPINYNDTVNGNKEIDTLRRNMELKIQNKSKKS